MSSNCKEAGGFDCDPRLASLKVKNKVSHLN